MKQLYLLIVGSFTFLYSLGQNAIDPNSSGNFDAGNTFTSNGWTIVNSSANKWVIGTAASTTPPSSPNTAYISNDGNSDNYSYDSTTVHISHFYRVVTLPPNAVNIALSFYLQGNFQDDADGNLLDGLQVYTNDITDVPVADALPGGVNAIAQFTQSSFNNQYVNETRNLNYYAGKTFLLIFTWINNADGIGGGPPSSVDGASLTYCIKGASYNVTGGGSFCTGSSGVGVGLSASDTAISYQLYNNGSPVGGPISGTGSALDFGPQKVIGNYTIKGTSACNIVYTMAGSVNISENPLPTATAGSNAPLCLGSTLNLTSGGGTTYSWTGPGGFTSNVQNPSIPNFTSGEAGIYTVTVTDNTCSASASTNVTVSGGGVVGGTISSVPICSGGSGKLNLSGNSNNPSEWESTTDSSSAVWTSISNVTTTLNFGGITIPTYYRAVISDGCGLAYSDTATVNIHNYWMGNTSNDWNTPANWSDNLVPSTICADVYIPGGTTFQPVLSAGTATITNLHILSGGILTITDAIIQIGGTISNAGKFDLTNGTLVLNGSGTQNIDGNNFANTIPGKNNTIKNLVISNNVNIAASANDTLNISGSLSFGTSSAQLQTGNNITLRSSASATANLGILAAGNNITGNITVERYIDVGVGHGASWEFLATPTKGQSVFQSWMENGCCATPPVSTGYGTQITGTGTGFDGITSAPALKYYNSATNGWTGVTNTGNPVYNPMGYMLFVRGDRSKKYPEVGNTTLRTTGKVFTASDLPPTVPVLANKFASVGNPYASAIYLEKIHLNNVSNFFYVWDPGLTGDYGVGAYQTLAQIYLLEGDHAYYPTPLRGAYASGTNTVESGQAFFVHSNNITTDGTVGFDESAKANGSKMVFRGGSASGVASMLSQLRADLYFIADSAVLTDGNLIQYNSVYSNDIDEFDAKKIINSSENFGILSAAKDLVIERRKDIQQADTVFYNLTGLKSGNYRIILTASDLETFGLQGYLEDTYLQTRKPLNMDGITEADFAVTGRPASYASNRFRIVFASQPLLQIAVTFISVEAHQQDADIAVNWKVKFEKGMKQYEVEKSIDGVNFTKVATETALNNGVGNYQWIDGQVAQGDNYYRIRCVAIDGGISFSAVVKVTVLYEDPSISIYPNPVTDGTIHLHFVNQPEGRYRIRLLNSSGQLISAKQIEHSGRNTIENLQWNYYIAHGIYRLEIINPEGIVKIIKVLY